MSTPAPPSHVEQQPVVLRRLIARLIDNGLLAALSTVVVLAVARTFPRSDGWTEHVVDVPAGSEAPLIPPWPLGAGIGPAALILGVLLAAALFAGYCWIAATQQGRSLGRLVTRLRITMEDGTPPTPRLLFGRDLVRVALICAALAILATVANPLTTAMASVAAIDFTMEVGQLSAALGAALPIAVIAAAWIGAALVDSRQRAPHDRLTRTIVVRDS